MKLFKVWKFYCLYIGV